MFDDKREDNLKEKLTEEHKENAAHLDLPIPEKLKDSLEKLHDRAEVTESEYK